MFRTATLATFTLLLTTAIPLHAEDAAAPKPIPDICLKSGTPAMDSSMAHGDHTTTYFSPGHEAMNKGLDEMHTAMQSGMQAENIDVAFVCGMIPHHQGAISMARAQLEYGKDEWVKQLSRGIIEAQEREIDQMIDWLNKH